MSRNIRFSRFFFFFEKGKNQRLQYFGYISNLRRAKAFLCRNKSYCRLMILKVLQVSKNCHQPIFAFGLHNFLLTTIPLSIEVLRALQALSYPSFPHHNCSLTWAGALWLSWTISEYVTSSIVRELRGFYHKINKVEWDDTDRLKSSAKFDQGFILQQSLEKLDMLEN